MIRKFCIGVIAIVAGGAVALCAGATTTVRANGQDRKATLSAAGQIVLDF